MSHIIYFVRTHQPVGVQRCSRFPYSASLLRTRYTQKSMCLSVSLSVSCLYAYMCVYMCRERLCACLITCMNEILQWMRFQAHANVIPPRVVHVSKNIPSTSQYSPDKCEKLFILWNMRQNIYYSTYVRFCSQVEKCVTLCNSCGMWMNILIFECHVSTQCGHISLCCNGEIVCVFVSIILFVVCNLPLVFDRIVLRPMFQHPIGLSSAHVEA